MKNAEIEGLRQEVSELRAQIGRLTEALVGVLAHQGPTYVPYVPYVQPAPPPWQPWITYISGTDTTCGIRSTQAQGTRMNPIVTVQESAA